MFIQISAIVNEESHEVWINSDCIKSIGPANSANSRALSVIKLSNGDVIYSDMPHRFLAESINKILRQ